uniref:Uncharacterized protein n=1 Tax=Cucumis sativus TaxID=3659 RepID=A0A0A0KM20_CUCSA
MTDDKQKPQSFLQGTMTNNEGKGCPTNTNDDMMEDVERRTWRRNEHDNFHVDSFGCRGFMSKG